MLRIALFTYSTKPRGGVIHTIELAEALHRSGQSVCVYALDKDGTGFGRSLSCGYQPVPAQPVSGDTDALIRQRIQEFVDFLSTGHLQEHHYDCYHAQDCISANALSSLRQQGMISHYLRTVHHVDEFNSPYLRDCQERSIREPDLCFCVSDHWQRELQQRYHLHAPRVTNGIDNQQFSPIPNGLEPLIKEQLGLTGHPIYMTVGGIEPRKNSIALLQAFAQVLVQYPNAQLIIAGGATMFDYQAYRDEFFARVLHSNRIEIGKSLILPGVLPNQDLSALYRTADAFVFPSLKEGWGLAVLEAIASGLPVITSNRAPFTEFLSSEQALLVDPTSPEAIAQAMLDVTQPGLAKSLIQQSQSICAHYTWEASAKLHLKHYADFLAKE